MLTDEQKWFVKFMRLSTPMFSGDIGENAYKFLVEC